MLSESALFFYSLTALIMSTKSIHMIERHLHAMKSTPGISHHCTIRAKGQWSSYNFVLILRPRSGSRLRRPIDPYLPIDVQKRKVRKKIHTRFQFRRFDGPIDRFLVATFGQSGSDWNRIFSRTGTRDYHEDV